MPDAPEATPLRKLPHIWILAGVTYGLVLGVTVLAVFAYKHYWPSADHQEIELEQRSAKIGVGDVWLPVYPGAIHKEMRSSTHDGVVEGDLDFTSDDAPAKLIAFYRARLRDEFDVRYSVNGSGGRLEAVGKRRKSVATMIFNVSAAGCEVQVHTQAVVPVQP
jgi:hypothetical protein